MSQKKVCTDFLDYQKQYGSDPKDWITLPVNKWDTDSLRSVLEIREGRAEINVYPTEAQHIKLLSVYAGKTAPRITRLTPQELTLFQELAATPDFRVFQRKMGKVTHVLSQSLRPSLLGSIGLRCTDVARARIEAMDDDGEYKEAEKRWYRAVYYLLKISPEAHEVETDGPPLVWMTCVLSHEWAHVKQMLLDTPDVQLGNEIARIVSSAPKTTYSRELCLRNILEQDARGFALEVSQHIDHPQSALYRAKTNLFNQVAEGSIPLP